MNRQRLHTSPTTIFLILAMVVAAFGLGMILLLGASLIAGLLPQKPSSD